MLFDAPGIRDFDVAHRSDRIVAVLPIVAEARPEVGVVLNWKSLTSPGTSSNVNGQSAK
jgi:hypothetical protein